MADIGCAKIDRSAYLIDRPTYLEAAFELLPECTGIIGTDLRFIDLNPAGLKKFGVARLEDLPDGAPISLVSDSDREQHRENVIAVLAGDTEAAGRVSRITMHSVDNTTHLTECRMTPLKNDSGEIIAAIITSRDISLWQDAIEEVEQSNAILQSILTTVPDAMIVSDEQGYIILFSKTAEKIFGYKESEILGKSISLLMPDSYETSDAKYLKQFLETDMEEIIGTSMLHKARRKDGTIFPVQASFGATRAAGHRLFTSFYVDLTEKQQTEAELQSLQLELQHASRVSDVGTLASSLAHELNQPLTAIANYLSTGRDMLDDLTPENVHMLQEALNESVAESLRAGKIVRRLREFVSKGEVRMEVLSMADLVNDSKTLGLIDARVKGVEYSFDIRPDINHVLADKVQIQQVMVNLIRNAIEAMDDSPIKKLSVSAHTAPDNRVEFVVQDSGPGISPEVRDRLFAPFATTKNDGMGLGLPICKTIIEAHGGELAFEDAPEGGAIFRFSLKKAPKEHPHAE